MVTDRHWWDIIALVNLEHTATKYEEKGQYYTNCALNYSVSVFMWRTKKNQFIVRELQSFQNSVNPLIY